MNYWADKLKLNTDTPEGAAIAAIITDLTGRGGIGNEFEMIDLKTQKSLAKKWCGIVRKAHKAHK